MDRRFVIPWIVATGRGCLGQIGPIAAGMGKRALLVAGKKSLAASGALAEIESILRRSGVGVAVFDSVPPEPTLSCVEEGIGAARAQECDLVIGAGGGSAMDAAKAIGALANETGPLRGCFDGAEILGPGLPVAAIPTTSGSGAEATPNSVLTDSGRRIKRSVRGRGILPAAAVADPDLTVSCPGDITASAGLDALAQAIESYVSRFAWPMSEAASLGAFELVAANLRRAWEDGSDVEAREAMGYGSLLAGVGLANARLGIVHGLAHPLGTSRGIPHGRLCGILLAHSMRFNLPAAGEKFERLSRIVGGDAVEFVDRLRADMGLPENLRGYAIGEADLPGIIEEALASGSTAANPRRVTGEDLREFLEGIV